MSHDAPEGVTSPIQKEKLAGKIDEDLQVIAYHVPPAVKLAAAGKILRLCEVPEVGRLEAAYMGQFTIRVTALSEDESYGWYQDFELGEYKKSYGGQPRLNSDNATKPEDFDGCPVELEKLDRLVHMLRYFYVEQGISQHITDFETQT